MKTLFYFSWGFFLACIFPGFFLWKIPLYIISVFIFDALIFDKQDTNPRSYRNDYYERPSIGEQILHFVGWVFIILLVSIILFIFMLCF